LIVDIKATELSSIDLSHEIPACTSHENRKIEAGVNKSKTDYLPQLPVSKYFSHDFN